MEELLMFFALGTWGFFAALGLLVVGLIIFSEKEGTKATVALVAGAAFLQFIAKYDLLGLLRSRPYTILGYAALYVAIGLAWSVVKWWSYVKKQRREYDRRRREFLRERENHTGVMTAFEKKDFEYRYRNEPVEVPQVTKHKADIIRWMTYWPFSALFTLLNDPVRRLFEWLYEAVGQHLQKIADQAFRGVEADRLNAEDRALLDKQISR